MLEALREFWPIIMALVGGVFWLAALEGRVKKNAEGLHRLESRMDRERADTREALTDLKDMLAEQNRDIKILLGRGHQVHWNDRTQPPR